MNDWIKTNALGVFLATITLCTTITGSYVAIKSGLDGLQNQVVHAKKDLTEIKKEFKENSKILSNYKVDSVKLEDITHKVQENTSSIRALYEDISVLKTGSLLTHELLKDLKDAVKDSAKNTKKLTEAVIKLDARVNHLDLDKLER